MNLGLVVAYINIFMLIFSRMLGFFFIAPLFSRTSIPTIVKISLCVIFSYILLPFQTELVNQNFNAIELAYLSIKELTIGLSLGFIAQLFFNIIITGGAIIDMDIGFSMSKLYDPSIGAQVSVTSKLLDIVGYLIFFAIDGHHYLIKALINSYGIFPIGAKLTINENFLNFFIKLTSYIFVSAVTLAIPIMICIFLSNLLLAFMAKIMPQMNVFIVGMPMKIFIGLAILYVSLPLMTQLIKRFIFDMFKYMYMFMNIIKG